MTLRQLEAFIAVAETGSFSKGAEAASVTQSTMSQNISALEEEFGIRLFERTGRGVVTTEGGKILLEKARRLLHYAADIPVAIAHVKGVEETVLRIAGSSIPGEFLIPAALPRLARRYPHVRVTLTLGDSRRVQDLIASELVECGVVGGHFAGKGLEFMPLCDDEILLVVPPGHRWTDVEAIRAADLPTEPFVLREPGSGTGQSVARALRDAGIAPDSLLTAAVLGSNNAVTHAVRSGLGAAFVSAHAVAGDVARGTLARVRLEGITIMRQLYIVKQKRKALSPAARAFVDVMHEQYGNGQGV